MVAASRWSDEPATGEVAAVPGGIGLDKDNGGTKAMGLMCNLTRCVHKKRS